ncbi:hypothetical protein M885DRAFT_624366 [Pelagophyceae sp. CCMP2097]|nr:hypothetical protein M885DRAFT_624366 [Pelagophyceae sp. CCMP2097]
MLFDEGWERSLKIQGCAIIDVRNANELAEASAVFGALHLPCPMAADPASVISEAVEGLDKAKPVVVYCAVGGRSARVVVALRLAGFAAAVNGGSRDNVAEKMAQMA